MVGKSVYPSWCPRYEKLIEIRKFKASPVEQIRHLVTCSIWHSAREAANISGSRSVFHALVIMSDTQNFHQSHYMLSNSICRRVYRFRSGKQYSIVSISLPTIHLMSLSVSLSLMAINSTDTSKTFLFLSQKQGAIWSEGWRSPILKNQSCIQRNSLCHKVLFDTLGDSNKNCLFVFFILLPSLQNVNKTLFETWVFTNKCCLSK